MYTVDVPRRLLHGCLLLHCCVCLQKAQCSRLQQGSLSTFLHTSLIQLAHMSLCLVMVGPLCDQIIPWSVKIYLNCRHSGLENFSIGIHTKDTTHPEILASWEWNLLLSHCTNPLLFVVWLRFLFSLVHAALAASAWHFPSGGQI